MILGLILSLAFFNCDAKKENMDAKKAEEIAGDWWGIWYRGDNKLGAAWYDETVKRYYVGVCDGYADEAGYKRIVTGEEGAYYNESYDAKFKTPDGKKWYKNARWFGYGNTYEEALYNGLKKGHCPLDGPKPNGKPDLSKRDKFIKEYGLKPFKYGDEK